MNTYKRSRINYRKIYENYYGVKIGVDDRGRSNEIHHIDGNHNNNDPKNLKEVTIQEHFDIHYSQCDYFEVHMIARRMGLTKEQRSKISSMLNHKMYEEGRHPSQNPIVKEKILNKRKELIRNGEYSSQRNEVKLKMKQTALDKVKNNQHPLQQNTSPTQIAWNCEYCYKSGKGMSNFLRWHGKNCKIKNSENREKKSQNSSFKSNNPSNKIIKCAHCNRLIKGSGNYNRWHGDNCRKISCN